MVERRPRFEIPEILKVSSSPLGAGLEKIHLATETWTLRGRPGYLNADMVRPKNSKAII